mmetsp:Transcript_38201/g.101817  ORF Transcript_38201/g.101817 Transcript_38201/m.101817 type:complete len:326 (+) Transcript_38201:23-1000(+)
MQLGHPTCACTCKGGGPSLVYGRLCGRLGRRVRDLRRPTCRILGGALDGGALDGGLHGGLRHLRLCGHGTVLRLLLLLLLLLLVLLLPLVPMLEVLLVRVVALRARRARERVGPLFLGDVPEDHHLWITAIAMSAHRGLKLHPISRHHVPDLFVPLVPKQHRDIGVVTPSVLVPRRVHLDHHDALRFHEEHVKTFPNDADLALPLEAPPPVPLLEGLRGGGPVRQGGPGPAVEEEVLPRQHRGRALVLLMCRVQLDGGTQQVERDNEPHDAQHDRHVLPRQHHGAIADLARHDLRPEGRQVDPRLPLDDVEAPRTMVDDILECRP